MSVKVAVRARPMNESELKEEGTVVVHMNDNEVSVVGSVLGTGGRFVYDSALWSVNQAVDGSSNADATQEVVYNEVGKELLTHILTGYNGCIFAYGQTGSGKTYCMMGNEDNAGLIPRIAESLFTQSSALNTQNTEVCVEVSYYEIYNEKVRCLLRPTQGGFDDSQLRVREHPTFGPFIEGLAKFVVSSQEEFLQLMNDGNKVRTTASTAMNATSSRSHAVFAVTLTQKTKKGVLVTQKTSRLNLVDLAGSERVAKSLATGVRLKEGSNINKSLACLGNVISALAEVEETGKKRHIPYRDSTLTWILKDNLGGNSKTVMLATVSPSSLHYEETMSTLRYAERAKKIMNNAVVNETNNNELIANLQKEISALKHQLASASLTERARLQEELDASEAVKRELTASLEEKLVGTRRLMDEREQYMRELEQRLNAQTAEIEKLRSANDEKERLIDELLQRIRGLTTADAEKVEQIREQVAVLEQEQNDAETHMKEQRRQQQEEMDTFDDDLDLNRDREGNWSAADLADRTSRSAAGDSASFSIFHSDGLLRDTAVPAAVREAGKLRSRTSSIGAFCHDQTAEEDQLEDAVDSDLELDSHTANVDGSLIREDELQLSAEADSDLEAELGVDSDLHSPPKSSGQPSLRGTQTTDSAILLPELTEVATAAVGEPEEVALIPATPSGTPSSEAKSPDMVLTPTAVAAAATDLVSSAVEAPALTVHADGDLEPPTVIAVPAGTVRPVTPSNVNDNFSAITTCSAAEVVAPAAAVAPPPSRPAHQGATISEVQVALEDFFTKCREKPEIYAPNDHTAQLLVPSHALPNNRFLREPFRVTTLHNSSTLLSREKDRSWEVDLFRGLFTNLDAAGVKSFELSAQNLFRVEKDPTHSRRITASFFDVVHPYELEFATTARRQQFFELAMVLRRNSILWCPSLCLDGENDVTITVKGTTVDRPPTKNISVEGEVKMTVARMPYEVIDLWYGCFSLEGQPLPRSSAVFSGFFPKEQREIYVIGVTDVPSSLLGMDELGRYFLAYLGTSNFFVLASTTLTSRRHHSNNAMVVICKRSFIVRVSNIEMLDAVSVRKADVERGDFTAVGCSFRINESSVCVILINARSGTYSLSTRASCIRALLSSFPFANPLVDVSMRFDYFVVSGAFHFGGDFSTDDALIREILADNLMTSMREMEPSATLRSSSEPLRIFYWVRPNVSRMDVSAYSTSRALGFSNAFLSADVFCQRSFLSLFGLPVPPLQLVLAQLAITGPRLPNIDSTELEISMDTIEGSPRAYMLVEKNGEYLLPTGEEVCLQSSVGNTEFMRLQTLTFTLLGDVGSAAAQKRIVVASGVFPLKSVVLATPMTMQVPLFYRGCTVGKLSGVMLQVYDERNNAELSRQGLHDARYATLVSCYENEVLGSSGKWRAPSHGKDGIYHFSASDPSEKQQREDFALPDVDTWRWLTTWQHDERDDYAEGWAYADGIDVQLELSVGPKTMFRRRRWTRVMQAGSPILYHYYLEKKHAAGK